MTYRSFLTGLLIPFLFSYAITLPSAAPRAAGPDAGEYIVSLARETTKLLADTNIDAKSRAEIFRGILKQNLDIPIIARRVLGPYRKRATDVQLSEFTTLLEDNIALRYARLFENYQGEALELVDTKPGRRDTEIVSTRIFPAGDAEPISVLWVTHRVDDLPKVIDIVVARVSMVKAQREEYVSVIRRGGGKIDALITELRERNAELHESFRS